MASQDEMSRRTDELLASKNNKGLNARLLTIEYDLHPTVRLVPV